MIARIWRGRTPADKADAYMAFLEESGLADYRTTAGNQGVWVLRRIKEGAAEFLLISFWDSWEAIARFAGEDIDKAVYYPEDDDFLLEKEPHVAHYEVISK